MIYVYLFGGILLVLLVAVLASALRQETDDVSEPAEASPEARRDAALDALRELEFEYRTGKLPEEEYGRLRRRYGRVALAARGEAEGLQPGAGSESPAPASEAPARPTSPPDGPPAACASCGAALAAEDRFCSRCGARRA